MRKPLLHVRPYVWSDDFRPAGTAPEADEHVEVALESRLGSGAYGTVLKGRSVCYPAHVCACKLFFNNKNDSAASESKLKAELDVLSTLSPATAPPHSSRFVSFYGTIPRDQVRFDGDVEMLAKEDFCGTVLLMEYINGGTLASWLKRFDDLIDFDCILRFLQQCAAAVDCLHEEKQLLHRDIKPANFLVRLPHTPAIVDSGGDSAPSASERYYLLRHSELVLTDFGEATSCSGDGDAGSLRKILGTPGFCAPEILKVWGCQVDCLYGKKADIWSVGAIFYVYLALGVGEWEQGMLSIFASVAEETSSLFSSEAVSILLLSKCVFPTLMQLRYSAFVPAAPTGDNGYAGQRYPGTMSEETYTRYTVMDDGANALDHWKQHTVQFAKMQRRLHSRWACVPDTVLQAIDSMMSPDPSLRPDAPALLGCLNSLKATPIPSCAQWSRLLEFQTVVKWHVALTDVESCLDQLVAALHRTTNVDKQTIRACLPSISHIKACVQAQRGDIPPLHHVLLSSSISCIAGNQAPKPDALLKAFSQAYISGSCHLALI